MHRLLFFLLIGMAVNVFSSHYSLGACSKASYRWIGCHHLLNSFLILGHSNDFSFAHCVKITNLCVGRVVKPCLGLGGWEESPQSTRKEGVQKRPAVAQTAEAQLVSA